MKIAILGAGAYGTALGGILADNGYDIDYYDVEVEKERLKDVMAGAGLVVMVIPSRAVGYMLPHLPKNKPFVVATKGILGDKMFESFKDWMVLSGPGFADDIKAHKKVALTVTDERLREYFAADYIDFDQTSDRHGVLMCGALKNVYAIYAGYLELTPGSLESKQFLEAAAEEMRKILAANSAEAATVDLACGKGDLELTCAPESRNYSFGLRLRESHDSEWHLSDPGSRPPAVAGAAPLLSPRASDNVLKMPFPNHVDYAQNQTVEGLSAIKRIHRGEITVPEDLPILEKIISLVDEEN